MPREKSLQRLYWHEGLSQAQIAKRLGVSRSLIQSRMKKLDVPSRGHWQLNKHQRRNRKMPDRETLVWLYWHERLSLNGIARCFQVSPQTAMRWLEGYEIPRRPFEEVARTGRRPSKPERKLSKIIKGQNLPYRYVGDGSVVLHGFNPDFIQVNGKKRLIELFGRYWHADRPNLPWYQTELGRIGLYKQLGFETLIIWEEELASERVVVEKIRAFEMRG